MKLARRIAISLGSLLALALAGGAHWRASFHRTRIQLRSDPGELGIASWCQQAWQTCLAYRIVVGRDATMRVPAPGEESRVTLP